MEQLVLQFLDCKVNVVCVDFFSPRIVAGFLAYFGFFFLSSKEKLFYNNTKSRAVVYAFKVISMIFCAIIY